MVDVTGISENDYNDADQHAPNFDPIPAGKYNFVFSQDFEAKIADKHNGDRNYTRLEYVAEVFDGPYKGRKVFDAFNNMFNQAPKTDKELTAKRISVAQFNAVQEAILGHGQRCTDTSQLVSRPFAATVKVEPQRTDQNTGQVYEARNRMGGKFEAFDPNLAMQQQAAATGAPAAGGMAAPGMAMQNPGAVQQNPGGVAMQNPGTVQQNPGQVQQVQQVQQNPNQTPPQQQTQMQNPGNVAGGAAQSNGAPVQQTTTAPSQVGVGAQQIDQNAGVQQMQHAQQNPNGGVSMGGQTGFPTA